MQKGRKKGFKVEIKDETYYESLIWMSYRYCIGRKTIAAHSHAGDIASNSYGHLSEERERFMAHDIRREINNVLNFSRHASVHDYRDHIPQDAMTTILYRIKEKYGDNPPEWVFTCLRFDVDGKDVSIDKYDGEKEKYYNLRNEYDDLIPWIKLANLMDRSCHRTVVVEYDGKTEEYECIPFPFIMQDENGYHVNERWCDIDSYRSNPVICSSINPEYIKEIK